MDAADLLSKRAELTPDREALFFTPTGDRWTYAQLNARANRAANWLRDCYGVQKGDRVSILAHNSVIYFDLFYGLAKLGAVFAPLNWRLTSRELSFIVQDCDPKVIFCGPEFVQALTELSAQGMRAKPVGLEGAKIDGAPSYEQETAGATDAEPERPPLSEDDPYCLLYTSGTTGRPKGAILPHRHILWNCINTVISWGLREDDASPILTPLFHAGGLFAFMTPILYAGGRLTLARTFEPEESLRSIVSEKCTVILGVPTLFHLWFNTPYFKQADFAHVRFWINGGAAMPVPLMEAWLKAKGGVFRQGYGLTEVGPNCFSMTDAESVRKRGSLGKPIFHSRMRLVEPATGQDVPRGEPGELLISGPHVCSGYWQNPAATTDALVDGWFHTGDSMRQDQDGFFFFVGRFKDMIKSGGENIYAAEVEKTMRDHPAVADAALIGKPDPKWGEVGLMIVILKTGQQASAEELKQFCDGRLARFKIPREIVFAHSLPYSPYGKVEKAKLREIYLG